MTQQIDLSIPLAIGIGLPLVGAVLVAITADAGRHASRQIALWTSLATALLAGYIVCEQAAGRAVYRQRFPWFGTPEQSLFNIQFAVGLDGLSFWLFGLSALLMVVCVLVSWEAISQRAASFYALLLVLEAGLLGVFAAEDVILFYVFFEFTLIPLFFLIGIWGSEERRYAAIKFFLFTLAGSLLTFLGLLAIVLWNYYQSPEHVMTYSIPALTAALAEHPIDARLSLGSLQISLQLLIFLALFAGFAIKVPLFPLHTWLPLAHTQAPTAGSVVLAGVLLKIGTYGFLRFSMPMLPEATAVCAPWILGLAVAGIVYGALVALAQADMKRMIAYSSVSHLGFVMLGLFSLNPLGAAGGSLQMVNHGLSTGGLFALVGMLYERYHSRAIDDYGGIAARMPRFAFFLVLFALSSIGLPGLNGFAGEFPLLLGMFQRGWSAEGLVAERPLKWIAVLAVTGVVLNAWYMLWLIKCVLFGPVKEPRAAQGQGASHGEIRDLHLREIASLTLLAVFIFWIGIKPSTFIEPMEPALRPMVSTASGQFDDIWRDDSKSAGVAAAARARAAPDAGRTPRGIDRREIAHVR
jgi:NADH-quinone oxidoreductase subunit M